jgi:ABC-type phosphate transport system substrate-binding protein
LKRTAALALLLAASAQAGGTLDPALPAYLAEQTVGGGLNSAGDDALAPLMDGWLEAFRQRQPAVTRGDHWAHPGAAAAFGALMFETTDVAPLGRDPWPTELAPYGHQFKGDMMKEPLLVQVATRATGGRLALAVNRRPGAPLPQKTKEFLAFVLSRDGQQVVAAQADVRPLAAAEAARERAKLDGYLASVDPAIPTYRAAISVSGPIANVGSDGMESLMEKWMTAFCAIHPGVHRGARWSHQGTLNGFQALLAGTTDLAPMGRELWPEERKVYAALRGQPAPLEIRVARGGFNTPQRTTAQAIFVHPGNPLAGLTVAQIDAIFGRELRQGAAAPITTWGQLGLTGEWADRPITVYVPPLVAPNAMSMQIAVLKGGGWQPAARERSLADLAAAVAADPGAIGFGGFEDGPGLQCVPVAPRAGEAYVAGSAPNVASGRYPLTRYMYIRLNRPAGQPLAPQVREFLRFILSREGQEFIPTSAYFPLRADEIAEELAKLDEATAR